MSLMHFSVKSVSRARGSSAVSKAAYDARTRLYDERRHRSYDYRARGGLDHAEILRPAHAAGEGSAWALDRSVLWNAAEAAERQKNSRVAREYVVALPHELSREQRLVLARRFAQSIADRFGAVVDLAVHDPPAGGDPRNFHAHVLSTTRELTDRGLGRKTDIERNNESRRELGLPPVAKELKLLRRHWSELANEQLREAGVAARLDPRTLREQGIDRAPQRRLGMAAVNVQRRLSRESEQLPRRALTQPALHSAPERDPAPAGAGPLPASRALEPLATSPAAAATIEERRQAAIARWLEYRRERAAGAAIAAPGRDRTLDQSKDVGLEL